MSIQEAQPGTIQLTVDGHVATILIDRPRKLNAITSAMDEQLNECYYQINQMDEVRAVVLRGAGDRAFCAGSDINNLDDYGSNWQIRNRMFSRKDYVWGLLTVRKPVIVAVRGYAWGGGLELCSASDIRIGTHSATFCAAEIRNGWHGGSGSTQILTRLLGPGKASEMLMTGDPIDAAEAYRCGLLTRLVEDNELESTAYAMANRIAEHSPIVIESVKNMIRIAQDTTLSVGLTYENDMFAYLMKTKDAEEGRAAFAEKRKPVFRGE
jgi:enoyl-CoA hydratase/carnithine racemase